MWFVYILLCQKNAFYTGIALDPEKRFREHISGKGGKYTRSHKPVRIVYIEQVTTRPEALKREFEIKRLTKKQKEILITSAC